MDAFDKMCLKFNTINAYLSSKTINPENKKVEYVNTFNTINNILNVELNIQYKECAEKAPKPVKQQKRATTTNKK